MSLCSLVGGIWRQLLIQPNQLDGSKLADNFVVCDKLLDCGRSDHLIALEVAAFGNMPRPPCTIDTVGCSQHCSYFPGLPLIARLADQSSEGNCRLQNNQCR